MLLERLLARAFGFIEEPGARRRGALGLRLRRTCACVTRDSSPATSRATAKIGAIRDRRAYDLLVQAESGLAAITGRPEAPGCVGVSACDIAAGPYAHGAILESLLLRERTGEGRAIQVSLFDCMADWMTVPLLHYEHLGYDWPRVGLAHPTIAPTAPSPAAAARRS